MNLKKILYTLLCSLVFIVPFKNIDAQNKTLMLLNRVPQATVLNPAQRAFKNHGFYISMPVISQIQFGATSSGIYWNNIVKMKKNQDSSSVILDKFDDKVLLAIDANVQLFGFGIARKKWALDIGVSERGAGTSTIPKTMMSLNKQSFDSLTNKPINQSIKGSSLTVSAYTEISAGFSYKITDKLTIGTRLKYLLGTGGLNANQFDLSLLSQSNGNILCSVDADADLIGPFAIVKGSTGKDKIAFDNNARIKMFNPNNSGFAADFGATYQITEKLQVGASALDLGRITWKGSGIHIEGHSSFEYKDFASSGLTPAQFSKKLTDSIEGTFKYTNIDSIDYKTKLDPKFNAFVQYKIVKWFQVGALYSARSFDNDYFQSLSVSTTFRPLKFLTAGLTYNITRDNFNSVGLGLSLDAGPFQIYFATDDVIAIISPQNHKIIGGVVGLNFVFGK